MTHLKISFCGFGSSLSPPKIFISRERRHSLDPLRIFIFVRGVDGKTQGVASLEKSGEAFFYACEKVLRIVMRSGRNYVRGLDNVQKSVLDAHMFVHINAARLF
jgi:hypothetical protein